MPLTGEPEKSGQVPLECSTDTEHETRNTEHGTRNTEHINLIKMKKLIAGINMSLDGYCDHTAMDPDIEVHQHFNDLLRDADTLFYGRITYQLMESYWPTIVQHPTGNKTVDEFALLIDNIPKIVYSRTLQQVDWKNSTLKKEVIKEEVSELKRQPGKNMLVGSPGVIVTCMQPGLIDEYQPVA